MFDNATETETLIEEVTPVIETTLEVTEQLATNEFSFIYILPILFVVIVSAWAAVFKQKQFINDLAHNLRIMRIEQVSMTCLSVAAIFWIIDFSMEQLKGSSDAKWLLATVPFLIIKLVKSGHEIFANIKKDDIN